MKTGVAPAAFAAALLVASCASAGQKLAYDPEGCSLKSVAPASGQYASAGPWANDRIRSGDSQFRTKANCTSNRALEQIAAARTDQRRNETTSFPAESPAPN